MSASVAVKGAGANSSILKNSGKSVVQTAAGTGVLSNSSGGMVPGITTTLPAVAGTGLANSVPNGKTEARTVFGHTAIRNLSHVFVKKEFYHENEYEPTQTVFLPKKFKRLEPVNEKIELLKEQTGNMDTALEDMKKNREEAKKQLEARHGSPSYPQVSGCLQAHSQRERVRRERGKENQRYTDSLPKQV